VINILDQLSFDSSERAAIARAMSIAGCSNPEDFVYLAVIAYASDLTGESI